MFHIILSESGTKGEVTFYDRLEADNLVELFAKLLVTVAKLQRQMAEEAAREKLNDDIPF